MHHLIAFAPLESTVYLVLTSNCSTQRYEAIVSPMPLEVTLCLRYRRKLLGWDSERDIVPACYVCDPKPGDGVLLFHYHSKSTPRSGPAHETWTLAWIRAAHELIIRCYRPYRPAAGMGMAWHDLDLISWIFKGQGGLTGCPSLLSSICPSLKTNGKIGNKYFCPASVTAVDCERKWKWK